MSALGSISILAGFVGCVMACITLTVGLIRREGALLKLAFRWSALVFGSAIVAALILEIALLRDDFSFQYVEANSNIDLPLLFKIAALWASLWPPGSAIGSVACGAVPESGTAPH